MEVCRLEVLLQHMKRDINKLILYYNFFVRCLIFSLDKEKSTHSVLLLVTYSIFCYRTTGIKYFAIWIIHQVLLYMSLCPVSNTWHQKFHTSKFAFLYFINVNKLGLGCYKKFYVDISVEGNSSCIVHCLFSGAHQ